MFRIPCIVPLILCACLYAPFATSGVLAATQPSAFLDVQVMAPENGFAPLELRFFADEPACRKVYGKQWQQKCFLPPGENGQKAEGTRLSPPHPGEWRWFDAGTLRFTPDAPWPANSAFQIHLAGSDLPAAISLRASRFSMHTPPAAASIQSYTPFVDPGPAAKHVLTHTVRFLYPTDRNTVQGIRVEPADPASGLRLAMPEYIWNHDATELTINTRVQELSDKPTRVRVSVPGLPLFLKEDHQLTVDPKKPVEGSYLIGGKEGLLRVSGLNIAVAHNERLQSEHRLNMASNLLLDPEQAGSLIRVIQLPYARSPEAKEAFAWDRAPRVDADDLAKGRPVMLENAGETRKLSDTLSFRLPADAGSYIHVSLPAELASASGLRLGRSLQAVLRVPPIRPELRFLQSGNVLPLDGEQKLSLHASGLDSIRWEATQVLPGMLAQIIYRANAFDLDQPWIAFDAAGPVARGELALTGKEAHTPQFSVLDLAPLLRSPQGAALRGLLRVSLAGVAGGKVVNDVSRFVLVTDLGLVVKKAADSSCDVFVASLAKGQPVAGATVEVLGRNGLPVISARTDAAGRARLPSLKGLTREKEPLAVTASLNGDLAYLPLHDSNRIADYSRFATAGQRGGNGLNAYVFSQRGIFRPGERLHFGCIVRTADWSVWPRDLPLNFALWAPSGKKLLERAFTPEADGLAEFSWLSPESAAAGRYRLDVLLGTGDSALVLGSAAVRIEEFQPDTLQLNVRFNTRTGKGWTSPAGLEAELLLRNLYGMPAADRRLRTEYEIAPAVLRFPGYEDYVFYDTNPSPGEARSHSLPEVRSDADGKARFSLPLEQFTGGAFRLNLLAEGFEPGGGRAVSLRAGILLSSRDYAVGYRARQHLGYIPQKWEVPLDFVALAPDLSLHDPGPLTFVVSQRHFVRSLLRDKDGRYRYDATPVDKETHRQTLIFGREKTPLRFTLPTDAPGDFVLSVYNAAGGQVVSAPFTVAGNGLRLAGVPAPGKLILRPDRQDYAAGDQMEVFITTPFEGTGLLTLEREGVAAHTWFQAKRGDSVQRLTIPADFEGRGYVNLSFARSMYSDDIYTEPHLVALAPVSIGVRQRDLELSVRSPEHVSPGEDIEVELRAREAGKVLLFAVDEGVLQLTRFSTPSPLDHLLRDRALEVQTLHALDLIMPDHARLQSRLSAFGGDMASPGGRFHNPFRRKSEPPLQFWSGITDVGPQARTLRFKVPSHYNGLVRIMAVGANAGKASAASSSTTVRAPLIITPQLPVLAAPGDSFDAAVALTNSSDHALAFSFAVDVGQSLRLAEHPPASMTIPAGTERVLPLRFTALDHLGEARVRFTATRGHSATVRDATLSVRPPTPRINSLISGYATESTRIDVPRRLYPHQATSTAMASTLPLPAIHGLVRWLHAYPYGCMEQLLSRAFPWAVLLSRPELLSGNARQPDLVRGEAEKLINTTLYAISEGLDDRGLAAWPGTKPDLLLTAYALDFLLAVREAGLPVPGWLENRLLACLEHSLNARPKVLHEARSQAYAAWLLTRSGLIVTQQLEILSEFVKGQPDALHDVTASLMAGSYRMLKLEDKARALIQGFTTTEEYGRSPWDKLSALALHMTVLARNFPERIINTGKHLPTEELIHAALTELRRHSGVSTFAAAWSVRALAAFSQASEAAVNELRLSCVQGDPGEALNLGPAVKGVSAPNCMSYALDLPANAGNTGWHWQIVTEGFDRVPPGAARNDGLEIQRTYVDANGDPLTVVPLGNLVTVRIDARSYGTDVDNVVLLDLLPGGFEMLPSAPGGTGEAYPGAAKNDDIPPLSPEWTDRREDRMIVFATLRPQLQRFTYQIRAVNTGRFTLPPVSAEAMYSPTLRAHSAAGTIEVK